MNRTIWERLYKLKGVAGVFTLQSEDEDDFLFNEFPPESDKVWLDPKPMEVKVK